MGHSRKVRKKVKYYKVKPAHDNKTRYKWNRQKQAEPAGILVGSELYTPSEVKRLAIPPTWFDLVEIKKTETYICFGARFEA